MKFRIAGVAACVAGLVVVTGIAAASAAAASDPLVFTGVTGYTWAQKMTIEVTAPTAVTGVTVHLWSGSAEVLTIPSEDFVNLSTELGQTGPNQVMLYEGNGSASGPSPLASLPLGVYTITADATDAGGDSVTGAAVPGTYNFLNTTTLTLNTVSVADYQGAPLVLTGQLSVVPVLTEDVPTPVTGQQVTITAGQGAQTWTATTGSDGSYTVTVPYAQSTSGQDVLYNASAAQTSTATATTATLEVGPIYAQTQVTATVTPATTDSGGMQTISGSVQYLWPAGPGEPSGWQAANDVTVTIAAAYPAEAPVVQVVTRPDGTFSATLPVAVGTTTWDVSSSQDDLNYEPFLAGQAITVASTRSWPDAVTGFTASLSKYGVLTVSGCLASTISPGPETGDYPDLELQHASTASGPWHDLASLTTGVTSSCQGAAFDAYGPAPAASAYYRVIFTGDSSYDPVTSSTVHAWRYSTRFKSFSATPGAVLAGRRIIVSGRLEAYGHSWTGYGRQRIQIIYRPAGSKSFYSAKWVSTNSKGYFSATIADRVGTAAWSANYFGNATHLVTGAPLVKVRVRDSRAVPRTGIHSSAARPGAGTRLFADALPVPPVTRGPRATAGLLRTLQDMRTRFA
jgi:hypothetical protein